MDAKNNGTSDAISILIVDSDAKAREAVKNKLLEVMPEVRVTESTTPHEAITKLGKQKYQLVICEFEVPRAGSSTLIDELNRLPQESRPAGIIVGIPQKLESGKIKNVFCMQKPLDQLNLISAASDILSPLSKSSAPRSVSSWDDMVNGESQSQNQTSAKTQPASTAAGKSGAKATIDVNMINPFIEGALSVIQSRASIKAEKEKVFTRGTENVRGDISAVIGMSSTTKQGGLAITFEKSCFLAVASAILGKKCTEINDENSDVAGDICNQILTFATRKLNSEMGLEIKTAIPSVIAGPGHQIKHLFSGIVIAAKFKTSSGWFTIEAALPN